MGSWCCFLCLAFVGVGTLPAQQKPASGALKKVTDYFVVAVGDKMLRLQFAVSLPEMQRGLMERKSLDADEGMIFVYQKPQSMSFWMHNTPLPLNIGFFDAAGVLQEYYPLYPFDENTLTSRSSKLQYALEVGQGWFRENKVTAGAKLDLKAVAAALVARGFDPANFGFVK